METYIVLLRGVNVGGHRKVKMSQFKEMLEGLGYTGVQTYIQSGNAVFKTGSAEAGPLQLQIEQAINHHFGFEVKTLVLPQKTVVDTVERNPFLPEFAQETEKLYYTFLFESPVQDRMEMLQQVDAPGERFKKQGDCLYFCYQNGYGNAKISNPLVEAKLKVPATTRNWRTMMKLIEMAAL